MQEETRLVVSFQQKTVLSRGKHQIIFEFSYFWGNPRLDFRPFVFMKTILFADDAVLAQSDNNLGKLQNSVNCEMIKVLD